MGRFVTGIILTLIGIVLVIGTIGSFNDGEMSPEEFRVGMIFSGVLTIIGVFLIFKGRRFLHKKGKERLGIITAQNIEAAIGYRVGISDYYESKWIGDKSWKEHYKLHNHVFNRPAKGVSHEYINCKVCGKKLHIIIASPKHVQLGQGIGIFITFILSIVGFLIIWVLGIIILVLGLLINLWPAREFDSRIIYFGELYERHRLFVPH